MNAFWGTSNCRDCQKANIDVVTKTGAKSTYLLKDGDLEGLTVHYVTNLHGGRHPINLFLESDIKDMAIERYGSLEKLAIAHEERGVRLERNRERRRLRAIERERLEKKLRDARIDQLVDAMEAVGLEIRDDSKLCDGYIEGTLGWTLQDVVDMCCEMHWLYNYTNYPTQLDKRLQKARENRYYFDYEEVEYYVRRRVFKKHGGIPTVYPWLKVDK